MFSTESQQALRFDEFLRIFSIGIATTSQQRALVHGIRYNVYCDHWGFEDSDEFPDGQEVDAFDDHAIHLLVTHRGTKLAAGCVRLVVADNDRPTPTEALLERLGTPASLSIPGVRRHRLAEISRLAVDAPFSRDRRLALAQATQRRMLFSRSERSTFPLIGVALFLGAGAVSDLLRRTTCLALMAPQLHSLLRRTGVEALPAGCPVMCGGLRKPYFVDIDETVASLPSGIRHGYERMKELLAGNLAQSLSPAAATPAP